MKKLRITVQILAALMLLLAALSAGAEAAEQRAFALENPVKLYSKADENSKYREVDLPDSGVLVPSAIRKGPNAALWYKVKVNGQEGWLFNEGIRLRMGPKSKAAENVFQRYMKARAQVLAKKMKGWTQHDDVDADDGTVETWAAQGALLQVLKEGGKTRDIYFSSSSGSVCKTFLGFEAISMTKDQLKGKVGTPTVRETPNGERSISVLSYEFPKGDKTLAFILDDDVVQKAMLYTGKTGETDEGWSSEVVEQR